VQTGASFLLALQGEVELRRGGAWLDLPPPRPTRAQRFGTNATNRRRTGCGRSLLVLYFLP